MDTIVIREYIANDEYQIEPILQESFEGWPKFDLKCSSIDHWKWKYLDGPHKVKPIVVAVKGDQIIGANPSFVIPIKIGDTQTYTSYAGDLAIKKQFRGQGISTKFYQKIESIRLKNGLKYVYFVTQKDFLIKSYEKNWHRFPVPIINMARINNIDLQLEKMPMDQEWIMKLGYSVLQKINKIKAKKPIKKHGIKLEEIKTFPEDINILLEANNNLRFFVNNQKKYLNWRFCDIRAGEFKILLLRENNKPIGYIVTRINRYIKDYPIGYIVDCLVIPGRIDAARLLLRKALQELDKKNINIILSMTPKGSMMEKVYSSEGFVDSRKDLHLFTNLNRFNEEEILKDITPNEIHFSYAAIDSVPIGLPSN